jgi:cobalt-zinc-cadmium efflux system outer membrane protein
VRCLYPIFLSVVLVGCVHYEPSPIDVSKTAADLQSRSLEDPRLRTFLEKNLSGLPEWPLKTWSFEQLALAAYYYHPSLDVARAQWRTAEAGAQTAGGRPNPTVTVTPGFNSDAVSGVSPWLPAISFDIPIETAHKRDFRIAVAEHLAQSSRFSISTSAWQVRSELRAALLTFVAAEKREALLQTAQVNQEKLVNALKQSVEAGAIGGNEVQPALILANRAALDLLDVRRQGKEARARIAQAIGVPVSALEKVTFKDDFNANVPPADHLRQARENALKSRSDVLGALAEYASAESQLQLEIAKQYPDLHISPNYQWDQGESKWALGVTVELPVLNRNQGPIAEAKARREELAARFIAVQGRVLSEVEIAVANYRASLEQLLAVEKLLALQREQLKSIEAQEKAGALTQLDSLATQTEINVAELSRLDSEIKIQQSVAALEDALQRPFSSEGAYPIPESIKSSSAPVHSSAKPNPKR